MTKQQLRIFTASVFVVFGLLHSAISARSISSEVSGFEDKVSGLASEIERLESEVETLESKIGDLEMEVSILRVRRL